MNYDLESIVVKVKANSSGDLIIPLKGFSNSGITDCPYDWKISVDNGAETTYTGTGGGILTIGSGLTAGSEHLVIIKPTTVAYQWARAFGTNGENEAQYITEIVQDASYMGFAISATNTGNNYRAYMFQNTPITQTVPEVLPDGVTTIGSKYYTGYYSGTLITTPTEEVMPDSVTTIGDFFRYSQYRKCAALTITAEEVLPNSVTTIGSYFRAYQYRDCVSLTTSAEEVLPNSITTIGNYFRAYQYYQCTGLVSGTPEVLPNSITTIGDYFRAYQYGGSDSTSVNIVNIPDEVMPDSVTTIGDYFRAGMYYRCVKLEKAAKEAFSTNVTSIGTYFRPYEYYGCISLTTASEEAFDCKVVNIPNYFRYRTYRTCESLKTPVKEVIPYTVTSIGTHYRAYQYANCINLINTSKEYLPSSITTIGNYFRTYQYHSCESLKTPAVEYLPDSVTTIGESYRRMMYSYSGITKTAVEYVPPHLTSVGGFYRDQQYTFCDSLTEIVRESDLPGITVGNGFRVSQYRSCPSITKAKLAAFTGTFLGNNRNLMFTDSLSPNTPITITIIGHAFEKPQASLGITNDAVVDKIYVDSNFLQQYKSSSNWSNISDDKFVGISTASVTTGILVGYKPNSGVDKQLILAGSTLELSPRRVLTGTENWIRDAANNRVYMTITQDTTSWYGASSTHGPCKQSSSDTTRDDGRCTDNKKLCCYTTKNSLQEFKDWLAQEYADGTPVIVINYNSAYNTRPGTPQDINVMDGENIIEVMSTAASKPEDIKLEATVGLDTGNYSAYVLNNSDYTDINNWIKVSETRPDKTIERGSIGGDVTNQEDLQEILDSKADNNGVVHLTGEETITGSKTFSGNVGDVEIPTGNSTPQVHITDDSSNTDTHYYAGSIQNTVGGVTYNYSMPTKSSTLATLADISQSGGGDVSGPNSSVNNNLVSFDGTTGKVIKDSALSVSNVALKSEIPDVIDNLTSMSTDDALSANQGRILMDEIQVLQARGRYLSDWNAQTGLAKTLPKTGTTYIYNAGDYFIVYNVGTTNYRPDGSTYPVPVIPSVEVETAEVENGDTYVYDGSVWLLQSNHTSTISFGNIQGQPSDNTNLANALNAKQNTLSAGTNISISGNTISATDTTYGAGNGISISGTTINNSGVLSVNGNAGAVSLNTVNGSSLVGSGDIAVQPTLVNQSNIKSINGNSLLGSGNLEISGLPTQTGNTGKFLQTNGTSASWNDPNEFLTQAQYDALTPVNGITYFIYEVEN